MENPLILEQYTKHCNTDDRSSNNSIENDQEQFVGQIKTLTT